MSWSPKRGPSTAKCECYRGDFFGVYVVFPSVSQPSCPLRCFFRSTVCQELPARPELAQSPSPSQGCSVLPVALQERGLLLRRGAAQGRGGTIQPGIKDVKNTVFKITK